MKDKLNQIRQILDEIDDQQGSSRQDNLRDFSALELPLIVQEIVDDLQPLLTPYECAFYWYLFRHSIANDGSPFIRVSTRAMQQDVVKSAYGEKAGASGKTALGQVQKVLSNLASIGAVRKEGEPNREGTPYRVLIPDEIEACRKFRAERTAAQPKSSIAENEIDYYNVRENRLKIFERDNYKCRYCQKQMTRFTATLDHLHPVAEGGDNSFKNLVTACLDCNSRKNKRPVGDFLAEQ